MGFLDPYAGPWTDTEAAHLARRAGFGAAPATRATMVSQGMSAAVDSLVDYSPTDAPLEALVAGLPGTGENAALQNPTTGGQLEGWWLYRMVHSTQPLQQQFSLFLHDTLVSEYTKLSNTVTTAMNNGNDGSQTGQSCTKVSGGLAPDANRQRAKVIALLMQQNVIFRTQGHLNYRDLLRTITRDPAMLLYLDNRLNIKGNAQENYSREVMELFSMGVGNYTEEDVREIARAFTGETLDSSCANNWPYSYLYNSSQHDTNSKTVFGSTFNFAGAGQDTEYVIDLIANRISNSGITPAHAVYPATSLYISWKLLTWFVSETLPISHAAVPELADYFYNNQPNGYRYDVRETLRKLFKSQLFYDSAYVYHMYKHPADFVTTALRVLGLEETSYTSSAISALRTMGMQLFDPPNVAGWNHGSIWVNSGSLISRFNYANRLSGSSIATDAWVDNLITSGAVANYDDNTGILEFFRARLIQAPLTAEESTAFSNFYSGIIGGTPPASQSEYRRKVRGTLHLMMTMPRYQLK
ncbi:MAG: DUF1800 domain-containing protein [Candidatus Sumerlaeaceae bacterium]|nr:DUF1800 domain-containing protein [Candidatus Sumerlaeaceae bacterium]